MRGLNSLYNSPVSFKFLEFSLFLLLLALCDSREQHKIELECNHQLIFL